MPGEEVVTPQRAPVQLEEPTQLENAKMEWCVRIVLMMWASTAGKTFVWSSDFISITFLLLFKVLPSQISVSLVSLHLQIFAMLLPGTSQRKRHQPRHQYLLANVHFLTFLTQWLAILLTTWMHGGQHRGRRQLVIISHYSLMAQIFRIIIVLLFPNVQMGKFLSFLEHYVKILILRIK